MPEYPIPDMADVTLEGILKAIADPTRLAIVRDLVAAGGTTAKSELVDRFETGKATVAHHFRILREAGVTAYLVHGRTHEMILRRAELDAKFPGLIEAVSRPQE